MGQKVEVQSFTAACNLYQRGHLTQSQMYVAMAAPNWLGVASGWNPPYVFELWGDSPSPGTPCQHDWVDTGMRKVWCKKCDVDGIFEQGRITAPRSKG